MCEDAAGDHAPAGPVRQSGPAGRRLACAPRWARALGALYALVATRWPLPRGRDRASGMLLRALGDHARAMEARTAFGAEMRCDLRDLVQSRIFSYGVWEPHLTAFLAARLREGDVFVDVGANVGYFTLLGSHLVGATGRVVAIDASPSIFARLTAALAANGVRNVRAVNVAISDGHGVVAVYAGDEDNLGRTSVVAERGGRFEAEVRAAPLTDVLTPEELARARVIKIDVEGAEGPVLAHLLRHAADFRADLEIVVEVSPAAMAASATPLGSVLEDFAALGYHWYHLENSYEAEDYRAATVVAPRRGTRVPTEQADLVLSRTDAPSLPTGVRLTRARDAGSRAARRAAARVSSPSRRSTTPGGVR